MDIFGSVATPKWLDPDESTQRWSSIAAGSHAFPSAFSQAKNQAFVEKQNLQKQKLMELNAVTNTQALAPVADALKDVHTPEAFLSLAEKQPQWLVDPATAPLMKNYGKLLADTERVRNDATRAAAVSLDGKRSLQDSADFLKELNSLSSREDRIRIKTIQDPVIREKALSLALEADRVAQDNLKTATAMDAQARGDLETTTITDKGVSTRFTPKPADKTLTAEMTEPKNKTLPDGTVLVWQPGGKGVHVIKGEKSVQMTPHQLLTVAKSIEGTDEETASAYRQAAKELTDKAIGRNKAVENDASVGGNVTTKEQFDALKSGSIYTGKDGKKYQKP